jgi:hypothetical protein
MAYSDIFQAKNLTNDVPTNKGTELMDALMLPQYESSPNLREYFLAFIEELDLLYEHISRVYLGRTLEYATGAQLDVIGEILQIRRAIELPTLFFGFANAAGATKMADESSPNIGGVFKSENLEGFTVTPLDDVVYRRVLRVKAMLHVKNDGSKSNIDRAYEMLAILNGSIPQLFELRELPDRILNLTVDALEIPASTLQLFTYMSRYFTPLGAKFTIN